MAKPRNKSQYASIDPRFPVESFAQHWHDSRDNAIVDGDELAERLKQPRERIELFSRKVSTSYTKESFE